MKRTLLILLCLSTCLGACGQYLRLTGDSSRTALYLDLDKVWNYNLYEHSRWGGGLLLTTHPSQFIFKRIDVGAYLGYGTFDGQWKYGIAFGEHLRGSHLMLYQRAMRDYAAAGSRHIANPWDGSLLLGSFMARRMTEEHSATLGLRQHSGGWRWGAEFTLGERGWMFDDADLFYLKYGDTIAFHRFSRLRLLLRHQCGFGSQLDLLDFNTLRLLADYRHSFPLTPLRLDLYTQGGVTTNNARYVDMFDLGGTWGAPLLISNSLATVRANEFTANAFLLLNLKLQTRKPLYQHFSPLFNLGSNPSPFAAITAAWGMLWGEDADGQRPWLDSHLQAPHRGILEPTLGVDGLIRWGAVDWGVAVIYRITPSDTPYHRTGTRENLTLLITGMLIL